MTARREQARALLGQVLEPVAAARRPRAQRRVKLEAEIAAALARGWPPQEITALLGGSLAGVGSVSAVLAHRLAGLADEPPPAAPPAAVVLPPWCGQCEGPQPQQRYRVKDPDAYGNGVAYRCPQCHPAAAANAQGT